ncbi:ribosomal maturation YjgA family protein [Bradyrhizobium cenepequi]
MVVRILLCLSIIIAGLALRGFGFGVGLPAFVVKYGGSLLWGTMVFFLVAIAAVGWSRRTVASIALAIAVCVELFRLVHTPWLDAFRLTTAGALLLGRIFSAWNIVAYAAGILLGAALDHVGSRKPIERRWR